MDELLSYESWDTALTMSGYRLDITSAYGSKLYKKDGAKSKRVCHFMPNPATAAWMLRNDVDGQLVKHNGEPVYDGDLPEFGLESDGTYHGDLTAVSKSMLTVFAESPVEFFHQFVSGLMPRKKPTTQMKLGTICHAMILEKKRLDETCIAYPDSCYSTGVKPGLNSKKAAVFDAQVAPLIAVRATLLPVIETIIEHAKSSKFGILLDLHSDKAIFETRIDETLEGLPCKCRPDLHIVLSDQIIVPDLKFGSYKPQDWDRVQSRFEYALQQSHYSAILEKRYGRPVSWSFWAFEAEFPYRVGPKWYSDISIEQSKDRHKRLLRELKRAYDTNIWEDHYNGECQIRPWDLTKRGEFESDEELTEETLTGYPEFQSEEMEL